MSGEQLVQLLVGVSGSVYRDDIKAFVSKQWRSFRRARTEDLKILTRRHLGPYREKHLQSDPVSRESLKTLLALAVLFVFGTLLKRNVWALWLFRGVYYVVVLRLFLVLSIFIGYRARLLPRVLVQDHSRRAN